MMKLAKLSSFLDYIKSIGIAATFSYIVQRYVTKKRIIVVGVPGIKEKIHLRRLSKDVNVFHQIFIKKDLDFIAGKNILICIDSGANIGLSTIFIKNMFPDAHIFSIEPEASNIEMLRINTKGYSHITVIGKAMHEDSNGLYFIDPGQGTDSFQTSKDPAANGSVKVESISMPDLMKQYQLEQLDFVKIDIEGAEDVCITWDAMQWLAKSKLVAIEIHEHLVPGCTKRIMDLLETDFMFSQHGEYSVFKNIHVQL